ncbi:MAG: cyanophycinase [Chitinophagaceae bacterium]
MKYLFYSLLFLGSSATYAQTTGTYVGPEKGSLLIVGGGKMTPELWGKFVELAGGAQANIVIIPTAGEDSAISRGRFTEKEALTGLGVQQITILHTRDPKVANTDSFVAPLKKATGVWFSGGRQWKLADSYLNTLAHKEFNKVLERGGVIGGSSAGATIQGSFLLRGDTKGNTVLEGDHVQGLDFIHNVAIDQHVLRRNRQFDLVGFIKSHPTLLGIGIDESTGIVVQQNTFEVIGNSYVAIYDVKQFDKTSSYSPNDVNGPFFFLGKGQKFDLQARKTIRQPNNNNISNE